MKKGDPTVWEVNRYSDRTIATRQGDRLLGNPKEKGRGRRTLQSPWCGEYLSTVSSKIVKGADNGAVEFGLFGDVAGLVGHEQSLVFTGVQIIRKSLNRSVVGSDLSKSQ